MRARLAPQLYILGVGSLLIIVDQLAKSFFVTHYLNKGSLFLSNRLLLVGMVLLLSMLIYHSLPITRYSLLLILAGGISNLIDRLVWGGVRDIFMVGTLYFNLADVYVVLGGLSLVGYLVFRNNLKISTNDQ
jgi:lipoprotein signal peptidase